MSTYTIGVVCSGNTCRSPMLAAWLKEHLSKSGQDEEVIIWSAALLENRKHTPMNDFALEVAQVLGMSQERLDELKTHGSQSLSSKKQASDLLVWITDPDGATKRRMLGRYRRMASTANEIGAVLFVVPESDEAWQRLEDWKAERKRCESLGLKEPPDDSVREGYKKQSESLREWAAIAARFVK